MNQNMRIRKLAWMGLLASLAIIFGYVEMLFPVFVSIPGIKLGLANLVMVFLLYTCTYKEAGIVSVIRIVVIGFLFGNLFSILFSLAGAGLSLACMTIAKKYKDFSVIGVSILGGITHNLGQIVIAALVVEKVNLFLLSSSSYDSRVSDWLAYWHCYWRDSKKSFYKDKMRREETG